MAFKLGKASLAELNGVHPGLVKVVKRAIEITPVDFSVHDGKRTLKEQKAYVAKKVSKTMKSKHLDGLAVDLVPYINGKLRWEWGPIYKIAAAMQKAAKEQKVTLRWGGVWDKKLHELTPQNATGLKDAVTAYTVRHPGPDFIDGPHFEIVP